MKNSLFSGKWRENICRLSKVSVSSNLLKLMQNQEEQRISHSFWNCLFLDVLVEVCPSVTAELFHQFPGNPCGDSLLRGGSRVEVCWRIQNKQVKFSAVKLEKGFRRNEARNSFLKVCANSNFLSPYTLCHLQTGIPSQKNYLSKLWGGLEWTIECSILSSAQKEKKKSKQTQFRGQTFFTHIFETFLSQGSVPLKTTICSEMTLRSWPRVRWPQDVTSAQVICLGACRVSGDGGGTATTSRQRGLSLTWILGHHRGVRPDSHWVRHKLWREVVSRGLHDAKRDATKVKCRAFKHVKYWPF